MRKAVLRHTVAAAISKSGAESHEVRGGGRPDVAFAARHPARILVAEDNPVNQLVARAQLESLGYRVDVVGNGRETVDAVEHARYDLVLMDVQMPVMDGIEATITLRAAGARHAGLYVVTLTASVLETDRIACLAAGMDAVVTKPVSIDALKQALVVGARRVAA